jgi:hypothetical protein
MIFFCGWEKWIFPSSRSLKAERESHPSYGSVLAVEREIEHEEMSAHHDIDFMTGMYEMDRGVKFLRQLISNVPNRLNI